MKRNEAEIRKIKAKLITLGIRQKDIADSLCISRATVNHVIAGKRTSRKVAAYLKEYCGIPEEWLKA